ncbi:hypothetical protein [Actinomadura rugatobispora]|uniref:Uncharacterized protein n=1 Tax=Actinomadura rugatobispora TaxID=1994 RepID=A0ABW1A2E0_9ACTN|nr:hypothetical protein GCM10010200_039770 [Actinomadura rugatobispora]
MSGPVAETKDPRGLVRRDQEWLLAGVQGVVVLMSVVGTGLACH